MEFIQPIVIHDAREADITYVDNKLQITMRGGKVWRGLCKMIQETDW